MYNFLGNSLSLLPYLESEMMIEKKMKVEEKEKEKEKLIELFIRLGLTSVDIRFITWHEHCAKPTYSQ